MFVFIPRVTTFRVFWIISSPRFFFIVLYKKRSFFLSAWLPIFYNICYKTFHLCQSLSKNRNNSAFRKTENYLPDYLPNYLSVTYDYALIELKNIL